MARFLMNLAVVSLMVSDGVSVAADKETVAVIGTGGVGSAPGHGPEA